MAKPRAVKNESSALSRTKAPIVAGDGLENLVAGLGTSRDKRAHTTYTATWAVTRDILEAMYRASWLAKRIVNTVADDMTRAGWCAEFDENADGRPQHKAMMRAESRFQIKDKVNDALRWSRLYGGAVILIGTKSGTPDQPLDISKMKKGDLRYLHVMDRWRVAAGPNFTLDLDSPNFGKPEYYIVAESTVQFHHTRVLRFDGQKLPYFSYMANGQWHDSELQHVYASLMDCDATTAGIASMIFEANVDVVTSKGLQSILATKEGEARVVKRYQLAATMKGINRMLLLDGDETYEKKANSFANLDKVLDKFFDNVCGATEIPRTRLFGTSAGGLNATGEGDEGVYDDTIVAKQETDLRPQLEYLYEVLFRSELGMMPDDFELEFEPLRQASEVEQADIDKKRAETDKIYFDMGVLHEGQIGAALKERGTYSLTDEDIALLEEIASEPQEPPPVMDPLTGLPLAPPAPPAVGVKPAPGEPVAQE